MKKHPTYICTYVAKLLSLHKGSKAERKDDEDKLNKFITKV